MKLVEIFKKTFVSIFCVAVMLCTGFLVFNIQGENSQGRQAFAVSNTSNSAVIYENANSLGRFIDGYVYKYTDTTKIEDYRAGIETSDISYIVVSSSATHGSQLNPYVISTTDDWEKLVKFCNITGGGVDNYYVLANDIDFEDIEAHPVAVFNGTFYGNGHILKNITFDTNNWVYYSSETATTAAQINSTTTSCGFGLFCKVSNTTITDLIIDNYSYLDAPSVSGFPSSIYSTSVGGIVGTINEGTNYILNCQTSGEIKSEITYSNYPHDAGIVSIMNSTATTTLYRCSAELTAKEYATRTPVSGGLVGETFDTSKLNILDCAAWFDNSEWNNVDRMHSASCVGWTNTGTTTNIENFIGYCDTTFLSTASQGIYSGALLGTSNGSRITVKNIFVDGKAGVDGNKLSLVTIGANSNTLSGIDMSSTYNVKETTNYATAYGKYSTTNTNNTQTSNDNLINVAKEILVNDIWTTPNIGGYDVDRNPVRNRAFDNLIIGTTYTTTYNGESYNLEQFYDGITVSTTNNCIDAGTHFLTVTLTNDAFVFNNMEASVRTAVVTLIIKKASLSISSIQVDEYGNLIGLSENQTVSNYLSLVATGTVYQRDIDNGTQPEYILEYQKSGGSWQEALPNTAGPWYVRANIKNADSSNYVLISDGQTAFTRAPDKIALPYFYNSDENTKISTTTTTVFYTGTSQIFKIINDGATETLTGISIDESSRSPGLLYSSSTGEFSVSAVGTYTVNVKLADTVNYTWADGSGSSATKEIKLIVNKANLVVTIDDDSKTSWAKGDRGFQILIYIDGIIGTDTVKFDVTYGRVDGDETFGVPENNISLAPANSSRMIIKIDTANIPVGEKWYLNVALQNDVTVNNNYNLVNDIEPWEFLITNSIIKQADINAVWSYTNVLTGTVNFDNNESGSVLYNGQEYIVGLNVSLLPKGINLTYTGDGLDSKDGKLKQTNSNNSAQLLARVFLTEMEGYSFDSDVITSYEFSWTITPIECDLSTLIWAQNFTYDGAYKTMTILNMPTYLTNVFYTGNSEYISDVYTAVCTVGVTADGNYKFINGTGPSKSEVDILPGNRSATITHNWSINKAVIQVSDFADLWVVETVRNTAGDPIDLRVPTAMANFRDQLVLKYYTNIACTDEYEIDPVNMVLRKGTGFTTLPTTYYAKVWLNDDPTLNYSANYIINNVSDYTGEKHYAILTFNVGGIRAVITLDVTTSLVYNGQSQTVSIKSNNAEYNQLVKDDKADYDVKYYSVIDDNGNYNNTPIIPEHVGKYVAVIFVKDLDEDDDNDIVSEFVVYCHTHYFEITQLQLTTDWKFTQNGTDIPNANVTANADIEDLSIFYTYTIYDSTGTNPITGDLVNNTSYVARLSVKDTHINENGVPDVVIAGVDDVAFTNSTEFSFTTGRNEAADDVVLDNPTIEGSLVIVYDGKPHSIVITLRDNLTGKIFNVTELADYVTISLKTNSNIMLLDDSNIFSQTNAGTYTYVITLISGANATWLWDDVNNYKEITFTIDKKPILAPINKAEWEWSGNGINIWTNDTSWNEWVNATNYSNNELGSYSATFELKDFDNTYWDSKEYANEKIITISYKIVKAKITGEWVADDYGVLTFVPTNSDHTELLIIKYYDKSGNEVSSDKFVEGQKYTALVTLSDEDAEHYEFVEDGEAYEILSAEFEYQKTLGFFEKALNFIKENWIIVAILCFVLLLLILMIIVFRRRKKKSEVDDNAKLKAELEKAKLEREIAEIKNQGNSQPQQFNGYVGPQMIGAQQIPVIYCTQPNQNSDVQTEHDKKQDQQIQEIRDIIDKMAKFQLATEEEKLKNKSLAEVEANLQQSIANKFKNIPDWFPVTIQDMFNHYMEDIYNKAYLQAKGNKEKEIAEQSTPNELKQFKAETKAFEKNYSSYNRERDNSGYIEMLQEMREKIDKIESENRQLKDSIEADKKERLEKELENTKQELAKQKIQNESLKEQVQKDEQEKLIDEIVKKNKTQPESQSQTITSVAKTIKTEFSEAFNSLTSKQKEFYNILQEYAMKQPRAAIRSTKYQLAIGVGIRSYIKFEIRRNDLIAIFGTTEVKVEDEHSVEIAKQMIDSQVKEIQNKK